MKKQLFAVLCVVTLLICAVPASALTGEAQHCADKLAALNLVRDDGSGYQLDAPVTRAQAAVLLVRLAGAETAAENDTWISGFLDLPAWAHTEITYAAHRGWVSGVDGYTFRPDSPVTANAWCTMLLRMLGYSDKDGDFTVEDAPLFAQRIGLLSWTCTGLMSRGDVFETMAAALTFPLRDGSGTVIEALVESGTCSRAVASALGLLDPVLTAREIADRYTSAVFCLDLYDSQKALEEEAPFANASGFFISEDGLAVTNYHSIEDAVQGRAILSTGEAFPIEEVLYYDTEIDVAVIRVSKTSASGTTTSAFSCLELAGTQDIRPGDTVYTLGNPLGLGLAVSSGIISAVSRKVDRYALPCVMNTADISEGSSGGALLNEYGQVIGITTGAYTYGNNMYLAVPADCVMQADLTQPGLTLEEVVRLEAD